jgi:aminoglycoside phosphotransferase (APT) family kinase protein
MRAMAPFDLGDVGRRLLSRPVDIVEVVLDWGDHACARVSVGAERFAIKVDTDAQTIAAEVAGHTHAARGGIPVPELIGAGAHAIAVRWVDGVALSRAPSVSAWTRAGEHLRRIHALEPLGTFGAGLDTPRATWREAIDAKFAEELDGCAARFGLDADRVRALRAAHERAAELFDDPDVAWCHGDFQSDHVLIDPRTDHVVAVIDWSDHGKADRAWDFCVITLEDDARTYALLDGYGAAGDERRRITEVACALRLVRLLGEACWLADHGFAESATGVLRRLSTIGL